ncbi:MAG: hypothetical protein IJA12_07885 [Oscillospiraceae bacterium]|nr:hypothetical protein [Oscillospiraceae bacterium]
MKKLRYILSGLTAMATLLTSTVTVSAEKTETELDYDISIVDRVADEEIVYADNMVVIFSDGDGQCVSDTFYEMAYVTPRNGQKVTASKFGLPDEYEVYESRLEGCDNATITYGVRVETEEELDRLYEESAELIEKGVILNSFKSLAYGYTCFGYGGLYAHYTLKDENAEFDLNAIEGLEDFEVTQNEDDPKKFTVYCKNALEYIKLKEKSDIIYANENIADFRLITSGCCVAHVDCEKTYMLEESEIEEAVTGDANSDRKIDARDCSYIAIMIATGRINMLPDTADFNNDSEIDIRDASALSRNLSKVK